MLFPQLAALTDLALLLLRIWLSLIFLTSGWAHLTRPTERAESVGLSVPVTAALGLAEVVGALSIALGLFAQFGAILLIGAMVGAIYKKVLVWKTGFWGEDGGGWWYDALYLLCALVILTTGGGGLTLT